MADTKYTGSGAVSSADYKYVKYVGKTKDGGAVTIELPTAICKSNPDWTFSEKDDVLASVEFEGVYTDTNLDAGTRTEPWTVTFSSTTTSGSGEIVLGVGKFYVGTSSASATCVGLTRGGGKFVVEREYREINADGDPGAVQGRIVQETGRPKLSFSALEFITKLSDIYSGMTEVTG